MSDAGTLYRPAAAERYGKEPWRWVWPFIGSAPITQGLDGEMFDRADYPYSETFVREAIQNTLDARHDLSKPAVIRFCFHQGDLIAQRPFLKEAMSLRVTVGLRNPPGWSNGQIDWLTIEDFNTKGLGGALDSRRSDFWNYWVNFGVSNKNGSGRGGRGIGRITFLIASQVHTVFALTRRVDSLTAGCAMAVLRLHEDGEGFHATHAYLAESEWPQKSVFHLHSSDEFHRELAEAFGFEGYEAGSVNPTGLALAIPYPHRELEPDGILAAAIEHFAPAIMAGNLVVEVDDTKLDHMSIMDIARDVAGKFNAEAIRNDVDRYLDLVHSGLNEDAEEISITSVKTGLADLQKADDPTRLQKTLDREGRVVLRIGFELNRKGKPSPVDLTCVVARTPAAQLPIDRFYREGMSLPDVRTRSPGEIDTVILVENEQLATYLNFCEGKAHLDLLQSKETKVKLEENGFPTGFAEMKFVKNLCREIRTFFTPQVTEPDATVFDTFFAIPTDDQDARKTGQGPKPKTPPPPPKDPPEPKIPRFKVETLHDGFRVKANPEFTGWPSNVSVTIAYADGARKPKWSEFDFRLQDLEVSHHGCDISFQENKVKAQGCHAGSFIEVRGFDTTRELDIRIGVWSDAEKD